MTNEQLVVILDGIQRELDMAIADARAELRADRPMTNERQHQPSEMCFNPACQNPDHFVVVRVADPVTELSALDEVSAEIGYRIEMLRSS